MPNEYNRENVHNKIQSHIKIKNKVEAEIFLSLFADKRHYLLAKLYYIEGYSLSKCATTMSYSEKQIQRLKKEIDTIAILSLLNIISNSKSASKLAKIKSILMEDAF